MKKLQVKYPPVRFSCAFCNDQRLELVDPESGQGPAFLADVDGDGRSESVDFLACRCGAEFHWGRSERPDGLPMECAVVPVPKLAVKGWRLFCVKEPLLVKSYTLHRTKPPWERSWMQRIIRIPSGFKLIQDGAYFSYHARDGSIILKPAKPKSERK